MTVQGLRDITVEAKSRAILLGSLLYPPIAHPIVSIIIRLTRCTASAGISSYVREHENWAIRSAIVVIFDTPIVSVYRLAKHKR